MKRMLMGLMLLPCAIYAMDASKTVSPAIVVPTMPVPKIAITVMLEFNAYGLSKKLPQQFEIDNQADYPCTYSGSDDPYNVVKYVLKFLLLKKEKESATIKYSIEGERSRELQLEKFFSIETTQTIPLLPPMSSLICDQTWRGEDVFIKFWLAVSDKKS